MGGRCPRGRGVWGFRAAVIPVWCQSAAMDRQDIIARLRANEAALFDGPADAVISDKRYRTRAGSTHPSHISPVEIPLITCVWSQTDQNYSFPAIDRTCPNAAGVMIGMPRNASNTNRSASPDTITSARPLTASSRNLSSFGSRQAVICSTILTSSAEAKIRRSRSANSGTVCAAMRGLSRTANTSCSVAVVLRRPPNLSTHRTTKPGHDVSLKAALTKTLVSTTTLIRGAAALHPVLRR